MKRTVMLVVSIVACVATEAGAAEGWDRAVGAGVFGDNVYAGSDDRYVVPLPTFDATYTKGSFSYGISLMDGLSASYQDPENGLLASISINAGEERKRDEYSIAGFDKNHSDRTRRLLVGSPNLSAPVKANAMLGYVTPVGIVGANVGYYPTEVSYAQPGIEDDTEHGFLYSVLYMVHFPVGDRLSFAGMFSLDFMDQNYAGAWFSVERETEAVSAFAADAGLRDAQIALEVGYDVSERVGISLIGTSTVLLGDARKSPYTVEKIQRTMSLEVFYRF